MTLYIFNLRYSWYVSSFAFQHHLKLLLRQEYLNFNVLLYWILMMQEFDDEYHHSLNIFCLFPRWLTCGEQEGMMRSLRRFKATLFCLFLLPCLFAALFSPPSLPHRLSGARVILESIVIWQRDLRLRRFLITNMIQAFLGEIFH